MKTYRSRKELKNDSLTHTAAAIYLSINLACWYKIVSYIYLLCYCRFLIAWKENIMSCRLFSIRGERDNTSTIDSTNRDCYGNSSMFDHGHIIRYVFNTVLLVFYCSIVRVFNGVFHNCHLPVLVAIGTVISSPIPLLYIPLVSARPPRPNNVTRNDANDSNTGYPLGFHYFRTLL